MTSHSSHLLQIDVSDSETNSDDLIKLKFGNDDIVHVNYYKLVYQSKYIRDNFSYSEALTSFQAEIEKIEDKLKINKESIKLFIQLIQQEKVSITYDHFKNFCTLSNYFCIPRFTQKLDKIMREELLNDLNFSIQILIDSQSATDNNDTEFTSKIEDLLGNRVNECFKIQKFGELPISIIYRIINKSDKEKFNHDLLIDFILESISTRFILLRLVELHKLTDKKLEKFFKFFDEQQESREIYMAYMQFNYSFIKKMKRDYEQEKEENGRNKNELEKTKEELKNSKSEIKRAEEKLEKKESEIEQTKGELVQTKEKLEKKESEIEQTKGLLEKTKGELEQAKEKISKNEDDIKQMNQITQSIMVCGRDANNHIGGQCTSSNKSPQMLNFDTSSLLSYSFYFKHSALIARNSTLLVIGNNEDGRISGSLQTAQITKFTEFSMKDKHLEPVSVVCTGLGTLFMFNKSRDGGIQLVFCDKDVKQGNPIFLNTGNKQPVALFGGLCDAAAICKDGEIIYINRNSVRESPESQIEIVSLPNGEKASSVACCYESVVVLSANGRVFSSPVKRGKCTLSFSVVDELADQEIVCLSGTHHHCLALNKEGHVFVRGSSSDGALGLGESTKSVSSFTEISSLRGCGIIAVYAGENHSLFQTREGKIFACGSNSNGELLLSSGSGSNVYSPIETSFKSEVAFCIAGAYTSTVFIGSGPPPKTPNMRIQYQK